MLRAVSHGRADTRGARANSWSWVSFMITARRRPGSAQDEDATRAGIEREHDLRMSGQGHETACRA